jgi:predicted RNA-binding Zn-ribbon protein involved in translation (DUF1610 family)
MEIIATRAFRSGLFAIACITAVFLSIGCETSDTMAVSPTNPACPVCGEAAQAQQLEGVDATRVVCPVCGDVERVDPRFTERLEIFTGGPIGDTVYACANCQALVEQCAVCRQTGSSLARQNTRDWR